jgi:hypothetical protein
MSAPLVAVLNRSTVCANADVQRWAEAVALQVRRDFAPLWGAPATVSFYGADTAPPDNAWQVAVLDDADQAGALGYHDLTAAGQPLGKVFAKTTLQYGDQVSVVLSHETLEMLADPMINRLADIDKKRYAVEVCDPVEADSLGYQIGGVLVSDFVGRRYFDGVSPGPYDFQNHLGAMCPALAPGGYISWENRHGKWHQTFGDQAQTLKARYKARPLFGSRRYRRHQLPRTQWLRSAQ